jgi:hypothetical protein
MAYRSIALIAPALLLVACNGKAEPTKDPNDDPALAGADLADQTGTGGAAAAADMSPQARDAARSAALALVGGPGAMKKAPPARTVAGEVPKDSPIYAASLAAASPGGRGDCAAQAKYTAAWADKLPDAFPVYPKGAVQEAAGTDEGACSLRVVNFITPVPVAEIMDFYFTRASSAGYSAEHIRQGGDDVLGGIKGDASFEVEARGLPNGGSSVDLIVHGG